MNTIIVVCFILGYLAITLEHYLKVNKTAVALFLGVILWTITVVFPGTIELDQKDLSHHFTDIAEILFFLLGAMTIVEIVDLHYGFDLVTRRINAKTTTQLIWTVGISTFLMSALLDNLTTTIIMITLLRKLIRHREIRWPFVGLVVIAANAGGAWSPIGDVTTTMLWVGGQISASNIIITLIVPSIVCLIIPLLMFTRIYGHVPVERRALNPRIESFDPNTVDGRVIMLVSGILCLIGVPIFKAVTHLPPYMGMLLSLSILWLISEFIHRKKTEAEKRPYSVTRALEKIDTSSVLFFLGILLAVGCLESLHLLDHLAKILDKNIGNLDVIASLIGVLSAVIDNVPQVAAAMGMYPLASETVNTQAYQFAMSNPNVIESGMFLYQNKAYFLQDAKIWEAVAYTAGTGGSMLIIGSAAGVTAMGMEGIPFGWYLKRISLIALSGFLAGYLCYLVIYPIVAQH